MDKPTVQEKVPGIVIYTQPSPKLEWLHLLRQGKLSIRQHLVFLIFLLFVPLLAIEIYSGFSEYQTQRQVVLENQATNARSVARSVTSFINDRVSNNRALGLSFLRQAPQDLESANKFLADYRRPIPFLTSVRIFDLTGRVIYADPPVLVGLDFSQQPAFQKLLNSQPDSNGLHYTVTDLRASDLDNKTPVFTVLVGIHDASGKLIKIVGSSVDTTKLSQIFDVKIGGRGRGSISIHDTQGQLVYNSQFPELKIDERSNRQTPSVMAALQGQEMSQPFVKSTLDGVEKMGASTPISVIGWSSSIAEPIEDAMNPTINLIIPRLASFGLVAIIAVLAAWVYSRYLAKPLISLRKTAVAFGQGDLQKRATSNRHNVLEVAELSHSFNQMADRLEKETQARDTFLAQAAHELKTPITVIKGTTQLMLNRLKKAQSPNGTIEIPNLNKHLSNIEHQANRMSDLVMRLLEHTRLQAGRMEYQFENIDFLALLNRCLEAALRLTSLDRHTISFEGLPSTPLLPVRVDTARIEQVVLNLLENAIKYSPEPGKIQVELAIKETGEYMQKPHLVLSIKDNGIGLSQADIDRIFERYYRAETAGYKVSGLGLGLYISSEIVRAHGGKLWVTSSGPQQGSTFYLALPLEQVTAPAELPTKAV